MDRHDILKLVVFACLLGVSSLYAMEEREGDHTNTQLSKEEQDHLNTRLANAISQGKNDLAREFLAQGANPDYTYGEKNIPLLFVAIEGDDAEGIELLLEFGADANIIHPIFRTPLIFAITKRKYRAINVLLRGINENKADVNCADGGCICSSPAYVAAVWGI